MNRDLFYPVLYGGVYQHGKTQVQRWLEFERNRRAAYERAREQKQKSRNPKDRGGRLHYMGDVVLTEDECEVSYRFHPVLCDTCGCTFAYTGRYLCEMDGSQWSICPECHPRHSRMRGLSLVYKPRS